ncbi:MAG: DUF465 domain-containing protein [Pyrinomonadaceae bacterium]
MDISVSEAVHEELFKDNQTFRDLVQKHQNYEKRLSELAELTYPNDDEMLEETTLKKKKLLIKDEIFAMMHAHSEDH